MCRRETRGFPICATADRRRSVPPRETRFSGLYQNKPVVQSGHKRLSKRSSKRNLPSNETEKGRGTFLHCSTLTHTHTTSHPAHPKRFQRPSEIYLCAHAPGSRRQTSTHAFPRSTRRLPQSQPLRSPQRPAPLAGVMSLAAARVPKLLSCALVLAAAWPAFSLRAQLSPCSSQLLHPTPCRCTTVTVALSTGGHAVAADPP